MIISKLRLLLVLLSLMTYWSASADDESFLIDDDVEICNLADSDPQVISPINNNPPTCTLVRNSQTLYKLWIEKDSSSSKENLNTATLNASLNDKEKTWFLQQAVLNETKKYLGNNQDSIKALATCKKSIRNGPGLPFASYPDCSQFLGLFENLGKNIDTKKVIEFIFEDGKIKTEKKENKPTVQTTIVTKNDSSGIASTNGIAENAIIKSVAVPNSNATVSAVIAQNGSAPITQNESATIAPNGSGVTAPQGNKTVQPVVVKKTKNECEEKLSTEINALLSDKSKNIIGLQFELTVLKMASLSISDGEKTFEGLIKKKSKDLKAIDDGSIDKMNQLYKKHGLPEDAKKITEALKVKATDANYYNKQKRFFNNDSSAFLMAYQQINPSSPIKESDISVLWFMDKVADEAKKQNKEYSSEHNRTNLSTRIAQYTGAIDPKKSLDKTKLDEMAKKQKEKIDLEFLAMIENFKKNNADCFNQTSDGGQETFDCSLNHVEDVFANLLAVNSKISSTDMVDLDGKLSGKINQASFRISSYVDSGAVVPAKEIEKPVVAEKVAPAVTIKEQVNVDDHQEVPDPNAFNPDME